MASTLRQVRMEIAQAVQSIVPTYDKLPGSPTPPFGVVQWPESLTFNSRLGGLNEYNIALTIYVSLADVDGGQDQLDEFVSGPIRTTLEHHVTTVWRSIIISSVDNFRPEAIGEAACLAADFNIQLIA